MVDTWVDSSDSSDSSDNSVVHPKEVETVMYIYTVYTVRRYVCSDPESQVLCHDHSPN